LKALSTVVSNKWKPSSEVDKKFVECFSTFLEVRETFRTLGINAQVPAEPDEQKALCDATLERVPGVLACGVPGAGGFDAVYALVLGEYVAKQVETFWETFSDNGKNNVCPLLLRESKDAGLLIDTKVNATKQSKIH